MLASLHLLRPAAATPELPPDEPPAFGAPGAGIEQLAFLVGGVWVAHYDEGDPSAQIAERCTWGLGERFIFTEVTQSLDGAVVATARGAFGYDPVAGELRSWSFSSAGTFQSAVQTGGGAVPPSWVFLSTLYRSGGGEAQVTMTHTAPNVLSIAQQPVGSGAASALIYHRQGG